MKIKKLILVFGLAFGFLFTGNLGYANPEAIKDFQLDIAKLESVPGSSMVGMKATPAMLSFVGSIVRKAVPGEENTRIVSGLLVGLSAKDVARACFLIVAKSGSGDTFNIVVQNNLVTHVYRNFVGNPFTSELAAPSTEGY